MCQNILIDRPVPILSPKIICCVPKNP